MQYAEERKQLQKEHDADIRAKERERKQREEADERLRQKREEEAREVQAAINRSCRAIIARSLECRGQGVMNQLWWSELLAGGSGAVSN